MPKTFRIFWGRSASVLLVLLPFVYWEFHGSELSRWGTPSSIAATIGTWLLSARMWEHVWATLSVATVGLLIGASGGIVLALFFHSVPVVGRVLTPPMAWLNSLPRILLVPIFIAILGIGAAAKLAMVVAMTLFVFFFNVTQGLQSLDNRVVENAHLLGATGRDVALHVYAPSVANWVVAGLRTGVGFAFIGAVISEYFGATSGLGYMVDLAYGQDRYDEAIAGLVVLFAVVALFEVTVRALERKWNPRT